MRPITLAPLLFLLPLGACATDDGVRAATEEVAQARLPEVRYYVIADT